MISSVKNSLKSKPCVFCVILDINKLFMKNSIAERIADFLKTTLLLNLSMLDLIAISKRIPGSLFREKTNFNVNDQPHSSFLYC
jgi:hypothetical protein